MVISIDFPVAGLDLPQPTISPNRTSATDSKRLIAETPER